MTESEASDHMEAGAVIDPTDPEWGSRKRQRTSGRPSSMASPAFRESQKRVCLAARVLPLTCARL